jgi:hypothetical protein
MAATKSTTTSTANSRGYKGHVEGSRKAKVHELYDKQGAEAAWTLGLKLKLKQGTLRSWFSAWHQKKNSTRPAKTAQSIGTGNGGAPSEALTAAQ